MIRRIVLAFCVSLSSLPTWGAAYIPPIREGQLFLGVGDYQARSQFDEERKSNSFSDNGEFKKQELSYFAIYTLKENFAVFASGIFLNSLSFENDFDKATFSGSGDHHLGGRWIAKRSLSAATALQASIGHPLYPRDANPGPGNRQADLELRVLQDFYQSWGLGFISLELAYRWRLSSPADQIRFDLNLGKEIGNNLLLMGHLFTTLGLRNDDSVAKNTNPNVATDYDLIKLGPSLAWRYRAGEAIQLGLLLDVNGKNTGRGRMIFLTWWKDWGK